MILLLSLLIASCDGAEPDMTVTLSVPPTGYGEAYNPSGNPGDQTAANYQLSQNVNEIFRDVPEHSVYAQTQKTNEIISDLNKKSDYWQAQNKADIARIMEASKLAPHSHTFDRNEYLRQKRLEQRIDLSKVDDLPLDYEFISDKPQELERLYKNLYKTEPKYEQKKVFKQLGLEAVKNADLSYAEGNDQEGQMFQYGAECFLDLIVGIDPLTSIGRSIYELYTGKNIVTGVNISALDRSLSAATILSLGTAGTGAKLIKMASKLSHHFIDVEKVAKDVKAVTKFLKSWRVKNPISNEGRDAEMIKRMLPHNKPTHEWLDPATGKSYDKRRISELL